MRTLETRELWLAAFLVARGLELAGTEPGAYVTFLFDDADGQASRLKRAWREGDVTVNARAYSEAFREMRRLSFTERAA